MLRKIYTTCVTLLIFIALFAIEAQAQKGKITGIITDANTGEPLPGVNVVINGTTMGTATDIDGYYVILNLLPESYTLRVSFVGYNVIMIEDVRVDVGLTTEVNVQLKEQVIEGEEVVIRAERPVVQVDISSNQANLSKEEIENLPVQSVSAIVGLQAGISGLTIRGGASDQLSFNVNGVTLRDERDNSPITNISLTSISNIQVQTGGFNAEYGNIRSGLVNVTTKEGDPERYEVDALIRYTPPQQKHFGSSINDPNSYWIRPFLDPDVAFSGTGNGAWDQFTRAQYPDFSGWIDISEQLLADDNPDNDLTPEEAQKVFLWQHRKKFDITEPDYDLDMNFGGPVPALSKMLGNLRFNVSLRQSQTMYLVPLSRDRYKSGNYTLRLTSDLAPGMKLSLESMLGGSTGTNSSNSGLPGMFISASSIANVMDRVSYIDSRLYSSDYWAPSEYNYRKFSISFTHTLTSSTYYEVQASNLSTFYDTNPGTPRDTTAAYTTASGVTFDEGPFGYFAAPSNGIGSGMRMGVGMSNSRDSSEVHSYSLKFDITSQMNRYNMLKAGIQFDLTNSKVNYASVDEFLPSGRTASKWNTTPYRFSAYVQDKLEFEGMIANLGVRMDMSSPNVNWYLYERWDPAFEQGKAGSIDTLLQRKDSDVQLVISPRLGVSFPITVKSKLFFNYGHFYSMPTPENLYLVRYEPFSNTVTRMANPNNSLPKTVAYELGYEQDLFESYLIRLSGYYRDVSQQPALVSYIGRNNKTNYSVSQPRSYQDVRGFEASFKKIRGQWIRGELNYTYSVQSYGLFGFLNEYESSTEQANYEVTTTANDQSRPIPQPFARLILDFMTPVNYGPSYGFFKPLADWRMTLITSWSAGYYFTWTGGGAAPGIQNNAQYKDNWGTSLRFTKNIPLPERGRIQFFFDVSNLINYKYLTSYGYVDGNDYLSYMRSLHLPKKTLEPLQGSYLSVPGSDRPGDYRKAGVEYYPIVATKQLTSIKSPSQRPLYYDLNTEEYYIYDGTDFLVAEKSVVDKVLKDKAYIDMPNQTFFNFLDPRTFRLGFRLTF